MSQDEFTKLLTYMQQRFDEQSIETKAGFKHGNDRFDSVFGLLDAVAKSQEISEEERLVVGHQLERLN